MGREREEIISRGAEEIWIQGKGRGRHDESVFFVNFITQKKELKPFLNCLKP